MRIGLVEWPEGLLPSGSGWDDLAQEISTADVDLLVTNELPFGPWIAERPNFDVTVAQESIACHDRGLHAMSALNVKAVLSSRPVWFGDRLANEAYVAEGGTVHVVHHKRYFPNEPGWYETEWYAPHPVGFEIANINGLSVGVLLCTDAMFNEHARRYGRQGADVIAIPRATGISVDNWLTAGKMAAIVSGSYVVSSNRVGQLRGGTTFGGVGFAYRPDGSLIGTTGPGRRLLVVDADPTTSFNQKSTYPCYVAEPEEQAPGEQGD